MNVEAEIQNDEIYKNRKFLLKKIIANQRSNDAEQIMLQKLRDAKISLLQ